MDKLYLLARHAHDNTPCSQRLRGKNVLKTAFAACTWSGAEANMQAEIQSLYTGIQNDLEMS